MDMGVAETGIDMISFRKRMQKVSECKGYEPVEKTDVRGMRKGCMALKIQ